MAKKTTPQEAAPAPKKPKKTSRRTSWLDDKSHATINDSARQMQSFLRAMADGVIDDSELKEQEEKVVELMKVIEPKLDDDLHQLVTQLLCEVTVYDIMQVMKDVQDSRPGSQFRG